MRWNLKIRKLSKKTWKSISDAKKCGGEITRWREGYNINKNWFMSWFSLIISKQMERKGWTIMKIERAPPKWLKFTRKGVKNDPTGIKREPKGTKIAPKVAKREQKVSEMSQMAPKGSQRAPKGSQRALKVRQRPTRMHRKIDARKQTRKGCAHH